MRRLRCRRLLSVVFFSSETTEPIEVKFHMEPPWKEGTKVYSNGPGHLTKMAAMTICRKKRSKIFFSGTCEPTALKLGMCGDLTNHSLLK